MAYLFIEAPKVSVSSYIGNGIQITAEMRSPVRMWRVRLLCSIVENDKPYVGCLREYTLEANDDSGYLAVRRVIASEWGIDVPETDLTWTLDQRYITWAMGDVMLLFDAYPLSYEVRNTNDWDRWDVVTDWIQNAIKNTPTKE